MKGFTTVPKHNPDMFDAHTAFLKEARAGVKEAGLLVEVRAK